MELKLARNRITFLFLNVYGHTTLNTPVLVRTPKLSNVGPGQYLDGRPPRNTGCCRLFAFAHPLLFLLTHIFHFPNIFNLIFLIGKQVLHSFDFLFPFLSSVDSKTVNKKHGRAVSNFIFCFCVCFLFSFVFYHVAHRKRPSVYFEDQVLRTGTATH